MGDLYVIAEFITEYEGFAFDILLFSLLNACGQLFIYKMLSLFQQHVPAFVIAIRKCLTVIINILFFGHHISLLQLSGIGLVFFAVFWEVWANLKSKKAPVKETEQAELTKLNESLDMEEADI